MFLRSPGSPAEVINPRIALCRNVWFARLQHPLVRHTRQSARHSGNKIPGHDFLHSYFGDHQIDDCPIFVDISTLFASSPSVPVAVAMSPPAEEPAAVSTMKVFEEAEVAKHNTEQDCYLVIGNANNGGPKVYDITKYLNDHPGGPEIMMEFAGKDADEMFEDIGHSNEARSKMNEYIVGTLKEDPDAVKTKKKASAVKSGGGLNPMVLVAVVIAVLLGYYFTQMA
jgi:cytochrome b involved in lipid metabolism